MALIFQAMLVRSRKPKRRITDLRPRAGRAQKLVEAKVAEPDEHARIWEAADGDRALYSCQCGLVFDAEVCTTVSCPHCGQRLAW